MSRKRLSFSEQIRRAIDGAGVARNRIVVASGIDQAALSRFMAGKVGLSLESLDRLAVVLGLDVVARGPVKVPPCRRPGRKPKKGGKP